MPRVNIWFQSMARSCQEKWNKNAKIRDNCELNFWNYSEQMQHGKLQMLLIIPSINANAQYQIIPTTQINKSEINSCVTFNQRQIYFLIVYMLSCPQQCISSINANNISILIPCFRHPSHMCLEFSTAAFSKQALPVPCRDLQAAAFLGYSCVLEL